MMNEKTRQNAKVLERNAPTQKVWCVVSDHIGYLNGHLPPDVSVFASREKAMRCLE